MAFTKILIERKVKPGKDKEFKQLMRDLRTRAMHVEGFISGETLQSSADPTFHVTISTWKSLTSWEDWVKSKERKDIQDKIDKFLVEPTKMTPFHYE